MVGGRDRIRRLEVQCREYSMSDNSQKKVIVGMSGGNGGIDTAGHADDHFFLAVI